MVICSQCNRDMWRNSIIYRNCIEWEILLKVKLKRLFKIEITDLCLIAFFLSVSMKKSSNNNNKISIRY